MNIYMYIKRDRYEAKDRACSYVTGHNHRSGKLDKDKQSD